eukprot:TRINITY_DN8611_c0_g1_i1.p1 TRINITY_DN8611_c0_g1~~TRINITY_DN8611_c0_g1_i1.p1  ORF type:complete len:242 (+),score=45.94 TRINITY_DN8611_c0_g1_i1:62-727(+)
MSVLGLKQSPSVSASQQRQFQDVFKAIDKNRDGLIDESELLTALNQSGGYRFTERIVHRVVRLHLVKAKAEKCRGLNLEQFIELSNFLEFCKNSFGKVDDDKSGSIDVKELGAGTLDIGINLSADQLKHLICVVDKNHDGSLDFMEYVDLVFYLLFLEAVAAGHSLKESSNIKADSLTANLRGAGMEITEERVRKMLARCRGRSVKFDDLLKIAFVAHEAT